MTIEEFKSELKASNLSIKDFAELSQIPYSTVTKYGRSTPVPPWTAPFLSQYQELKELNEIKTLILELAQKFQK